MQSIPHQTPLRPNKINVSHKIYPTLSNLPYDALIPRTGGSQASRAKRARGARVSVKRDRRSSGEARGKPKAREYTGLEGKSLHAAGDRSKRVKNLYVTARRITVAKGAWRHAAMRKHRITGTNPARPTRPAPDFSRESAVAFTPPTHALREDAYGPPIAAIKLRMSATSSGVIGSAPKSAAMPQIAPSRPCTTTVMLL